MWSRLSKRVKCAGPFLFSKNLSSSAVAHPRPKMRVCVLGAAGGIGQPLSLLLKHSTIITDLHLYDKQGAHGVAADLGHLETRCIVRGFQGAHQLPDCLQGADIVVIVAGIPRRPGMNRDDLFNSNARIVYDLVHSVRKTCPSALIAIVTNPINSTVPIAAEVFKKFGQFNPKRIFGVTTLDVVRANTFISELKGLDPAHVMCPVIGGHSATTMIPLFSQCIPKLDFTEDDIRVLTERIREAGTDVVKAKAGTGSATLSMAYAAARFTYSLMRALRGEQDVVECAYVKSESPEASYFATKLLLGPHGVDHNLGIGTITPLEKAMLVRGIPELRKNIEVGKKFAKDQFKQKT